MSCLNSLSGNSHFFLDYTESGRFHVHNACTFNFEQIQMAIPYDFQFNAMVTPKYRRHEHFTIERQALINAERVKYMTATMKDNFSLDFIEKAIDSALSNIETVPFSLCLKKRYVSYYSTLKQALF